MNWLQQLWTKRLSAPKSHLFRGVDCFYVSQLHLQSQGTPTHEFLNFDNGGKVYGIEIAFSPGSIDQVVEQFKTIPDNALLKGQYELQGRNLSFRLVSTDVEVDYQGQINGDSVLRPLNWTQKPQSLWINPGRRLGMPLRLEFSRRQVT